MTNFYRFITQFIERLGLITSYLGLILVVITALVVAFRYIFNWAPIALQETMTYLHASLFMLGAAYTLKHDGHVRVDVFYQHYSEKKKALINLLGTTFLLFPTCLFILFICYPYVESSWQMSERSIEGNGLPWLYALKTLLLIQPALLILQGAAEVAKNLLIINGHTLQEITGSEVIAEDGGQL